MSRSLAPRSRPGEDPRVRVLADPGAAEMAACFAPGARESLLAAGDSRTLLGRIPDGVFQTCITSPPYWSLRDYHIEGQIGLESSLGEYLENLVAIFAQVRRTLRDDGTLWLNIGDSYTSGGR